MMISNRISAKSISLIGPISAEGKPINLKGSGINIITAVPMIEPGTLASHPTISMLKSRIKSPRPKMLGSIKLM